MLFLIQFRQFFLISCLVYYVINWKYMYIVLSLLTLMFTLAWMASLVNFLLRQMRRFDPHHCLIYQGSRAWIHVSVMQLLVRYCLQTIEGAWLPPRVAAPFMHMHAMCVQPIGNA